MVELVPSLIKDGKGPFEFLKNYKIERQLQDTFSTALLAHVANLELTLS